MPLGIKTLRQIFEMMRYHRSKSEVLPQTIDLPIPLLPTAVRHTYRRVPKMDKHTY